MKKYCCQCGQLCDEKAVEVNPDIWLCEQCQEDIENEYQNGKSANYKPKEEQATPQPHPCKECNKYGCDVHCPYYGK